MIVKKLFKFFVRTTTRHVGHFSAADFREIWTKNVNQCGHQSVDGRQCRLQSCQRGYLGPSRLPMSNIYLLAKFETTTFTDKRDIAENTNPRWRQRNTPREDRSSDVCHTHIPSEDLSSNVRHTHFGRHSHSHSLLRRTSPQPVKMHTLSEDLSSDVCRDHIAVLFQLIVTVTEIQ